MDFDARKVFERVVGHHLDVAALLEGSGKDVSKQGRCSDRSDMHHARYLTAFVAERLVVQMFCCILLL
jgi:hypothetical protein